jgi:hypothetical protein
VRSRIAIDGIREAVARGDEQMRSLMLVGEPERTERALDGLLRRIPDIERALTSRPAAQEGRAPAP